MAEEPNREEDKQQDQYNNDSSKHNSFRGMGFDPSMMMGMMNPVQYQHFQQIMMMQQFRRQQIQRQAAAAAAAAMANNSPVSNIPPETQKPPTGYVCFKCGQPGHWIYYCPNVPKGQFVQRNTMHASHPRQEATPSRPQELTCIICEKLMTEAVLIPCCGKSYCKECITETLDKSSPCPYCHQQTSTVDQLVPNKTLRLTIEAYLDQQQQAEEEQVEEEKRKREEEEQQQEAETKELQQQQSSQETENKTMPIQVFDSSQEEQPQRKMGPRKQHYDNTMMMPPEMFNNMNWMNMGRPPFMNNRFPGFGMPPDMNWMGNKEDQGSNPTEDSGDKFNSNPPPFPGTFNNDMAPFSGMPPQDVFGFNMFHRGGMNGNSMRGRGRGRGGYYHNQHQPYSGPRRPPVQQDEEMDKPEEEPTRAESSKYRSRSPRRTHESSRHPKRREESRDDSRHRKREDDRYKSDRHKSSDDYRKRDYSSSSKRYHHDDEEDEEEDEDRDYKRRRRSRSPESEHRSRRHDSRHRSSRYSRSREERHRDRKRR